MKLFVGLSEDQIFIITPLMDFNTTNGCQLKLKGWVLEFTATDAWGDYEVEIFKDFLTINGMRVEDELRLQIDGGGIYAYKE
jgi:hypothetical protein